MGMLLAALLFTPLVLKADVASYVDDFEAASINAFWATTVQNGAMILTNSPVHGGNQALQLIGSGGGHHRLPSGRGPPAQRIRNSARRRAPP